jgi:hypothetical protein
MLKADKLKIEKLLSGVEAVRLEGTAELSALEAGHFEDHPISAKFIREIEDRLLKSYRETNSDKVKEWVLQVLAEALIESDEVVKLVSESLNRECKYLPTLLYYIWQSANKFTQCKANVKSLYDHPDAQVRWRCALVLEKLPLDYDADIKVIRALMLDDYYTARTYAVLALMKMGKVGFFDRRILKKVTKIDDGAARDYANQILRG